MGVVSQESILEAILADASGHPKTTIASSDDPVERGCCNEASPTSSGVPVERGCGSGEGGPTSSVERGCGSGEGGPTSSVERGCGSGEGGPTSSVERGCGSGGRQRKRNKQSQQERRKRRKVSVFSLGNNTCTLMHTFCLACQCRVGRAASQEAHTTGEGKLTTSPDPDLRHVILSVAGI